MHQEGDGPGWKTPLLVVVAVGIVWLLTGWWLPIAFGGDNPGPFGDQFGAANSLFSGLAFTGLIYAILLQRQELRLQRNELELTRGELAGQKEQLKVQNDTLRLQSFENTFFQLLRLHNDIVNAIDLRKDGGRDVIAVGRDCFKIFFERLKRKFEESLPHKGPDLRSSVSDLYGGFYPSIEAELGHYFRSLYNIVKFVDLSPTKDKKFYTNLVRAQISKYELLLLFYNCSSPLGSEKFLPLVEKYALLKMVPLSDLLDARHRSLFNGAAYSAAG